MTLDRRHMIVALTMMAGSIAYNVSVFSKPAADEPAAPAGVAPVPVQSLVAPVPTVSGALPLAGTPPVATASTAAPHDLALDRPPVWPRDAFAYKAPAPEPVTSVPVPSLAPPEPELVVNAVLYSSHRRLAIVNGRTMRIGERVGAATIVDILPDGIVLESVSGERTVRRRAAAEGRR